MRRFTLLIFLGTLTVCFATLELPTPAPTIAKAQAKCGGIEGRLTTPEGWLIPMARIYFFNKDTKKTTNVESDQDGLYTACLAAGTYDISVNAPGFKKAKRKGIKVNYGERSIIDFPLKRGRPETSH
jgi:hypothetical protein